MSSIGATSTTSIDQVQAYRKQASTNDVRDKDVRQQENKTEIRAADEVKETREVKENEKIDNEKQEVATIDRQSDRRNETVQLGNNLDISV